MLHECNNPTFVRDEVHTRSRITDKLRREKSKHHYSSKEIVSKDVISPLKTGPSH
jgi:hypothetical protein